MYMRGKGGSYIETHIQTINAFVVVLTLTSSGVFLVMGAFSCPRWGTGSDRVTVAAAADAQR